MRCFPALRNPTLRTALVLLCTSALPVHGAAIWIEGESAANSTMRRQSWYDGVKKEVLSGGAWISNFGKQPGEAEYRFEAPESGEYAFWIRANPVNSALSYSLNGGPFIPIDLQKEKRGEQNIAGDNKIDLRFIAWVKAGAVTLAKGAQTLKLRLDSKHENHGGIDAFVFTTEPFVPQGIMKPGEVAAGGGAADWFPLIPDEDTFSPKSVIDMSRLTPAPAGQFGVLKASGEHLQFEKQLLTGESRPVKLWGVGANVQPGRFSREQLTRRAKYLRKFGVNIVRQHPLYDELRSGATIDPKKLDEYDWWFAELKRHGIYTCWSVFYHFRIGPEDGYDPALYAELEGDAKLKDTYGFMSVSPPLWEIRTKTLLAFLNHKNPYTGLRYADDPALAIVEMQNEDSVFFWNPLGWIAEGKKAPLHSKQLRQAFAGWVKAKYKTDEELKSAWGELRHGDSVNAAELKLMGPWELEGKGPRGAFAGLEKRAGDYIQFLAEMQRDLFTSCEKAIRSTGFKAQTVTTAWHVGGAASDAANTWTDTVATMIDRHNYAGGGEGGHGIKEGKVNNSSHLAAPGSGIFSIGMKQVEKKPFSVTEWTQSAPNQWKLETAPIFAAYGMGLQGWDASFHFTQSGTRLGDGWPGMSSYSSDTPHYIGQFPALAFALRHGHFKESPVIAARRMEAADLFTGKDELKQDFTKGGYDIKTLETNGGTPAEAFAIGRVTVAFDGGKSEQIDFKKLWDEKNKIIRSVTGEMTWDYGRQVITLHGPKTQAVIGRAGGETFRLPGVEVRFETPFVSTIFTPLDDLPLRESKHILITALAQDRQTGARYSADGALLEAAGAPPLLLEPVQATLRFAGAKPAQVNALDHYGAPTGKSVPVDADGNVRIDGTYRAYYYEVKR